MKDCSHPSCSSRGMITAVVRLRALRHHKRRALEASVNGMYDSWLIVGPKEHDRPMVWCLAAILTARQKHFGG